MSTPAKCSHDQPAVITTWLEAAPELFERNTEGNKSVICPLCRAELRAEREQRRRHRASRKPPQPVDARQLAFSFGEDAS